MSRGRRAQGGGVPDLRRGLRRLVLPALTLVLILGGAAMPFAVSRLMDGEDRTELRAFGMSELALHQELEVGQVLRLIAEGGTWLEWQSGARLTEETALEAAMAALQELESGGLLDRQVRKVLSKSQAIASAVPFLVVSSSTRDLSALVWSISMEDGGTGGSYTYLLIDDASGMLVQASLPQSGLWAIPPEMDAETNVYVQNGQTAGDGSLEERLKTCAGFFSRYYDLPVRRTEEIQQGAFFLYFDLGEALGECRVQLTLEDWYLTFN